MMEEEEEERWRRKRDDGDDDDVGVGRDKVQARPGSTVTVDHLLWQVVCRCRCPPGGRRRRRAG